jgi:hypothetical protein
MHLYLLYKEILTKYLDVITVVFLFLHAYLIDAFTIQIDYSYFLRTFPIFVSKFKKCIKRRGKMALSSVCEF